MSKLHYVERFLSQQSEGRYVGVTSVFLRMFGCNFRCRNFNRYEQDILGVEVTHNPEVVEVIRNLDKYSKFEELPLAHTGCDSYAAVYPEFKKFSVKEESDVLAENIVGMLPYNQWRDEHLVITGGEPLLGWQRSYPDLLSHSKMRDLKELTFETNGTQPLTKDFRQFLLNWTLNDASYSHGKRGWNSLTFSVSPKLSNSGETREDAIQPNIVADYEKIGHTYLKFVVAESTDVEEVLEVTELYRAAGFKGPIYLMPVGGTVESYQLTEKRVAELAIKYGLRYSPRLQISLFGNSWGA